MVDTSCFAPTRRQLLKWGIAAGALAGAPFLARFEDFLAQARARGDVPLRVPPLLTGRLKEGVRQYDLTIRKSGHVFVSGVTTPGTFGVNGSFLGPTLHLRHGERVQINVRNALNESTTVHWHGMILPAAMDGGPHQEIAPGETWRPTFEVRQPAATLWYHAHPHKRTGRHVWNGLAGMMIIEDEDAAKLPLPQDYGVDDIPVVLQDRLFDADGRLVYISTMHDIMMGMEGDVPLCNGQFRPVFEARRTLLRLRVLNGANAAFYNVGFSDNRPFHVIASDGGLLPAPVQRRRVLLTPGERVEIVVPVSDAPFALISTGGNLPPHVFLRIVPASTLESSPTPPQRLAQVPPPRAAKGLRVRRFDLQMGMGPAMMMGAPFAINGRAMDMNVINEVVPVNTDEVWEIRNTSPMPHPFHVHDVQFRVLSRSRGAVPTHEAGYKDTVLVAGNETVRILVRFQDHVDPTTPYMYHCHILEHEDAGMMGQFTVVQA